VSTRLIPLVQANIDAFLDESRPQLQAIAPELAPFTDYSKELLAGGKRFRALFCYWGNHAVVDATTDAPTDDDDLSVLATAATALELFHAAALVHDDIMDNSDTRRGRPSAHRHFELMHRESNWLGDAEAFGRSSALLLGDLLLAWSDDLFGRALASTANLAARVAARTEFNLMKTEVTVGQYLDILEEQAWARQPEDEQLARAHRVITYKSAKYSVEAPLAIGGSLGGGSPAQLAALREYGLPIGTAFQLRDDMLGVFGDPELTGKPAGDDLREGKRTVLIAIARSLVPAGTRRVIDELLGDPEMTDSQVETLQRTIIDSGAVDEVERIISRCVGTGLEAIAEAPLNHEAKRELAELADTVVRRSA
jgi:geranylgeranyl diphosphate synthase, type I